MAIREKAGVIAKKIEGNPLDPEKAAKDQMKTLKWRLKKKYILQKRIS